MVSNYYNRFRLLRRKIDSIDLKNKEIKEYADFVLECSVLLLELFGDIKSSMQDLYETVQNRYTLQKHNIHIIAEEKVHDQFLADQILHFKQTIADFQRLYFPQEDPCLLHITSREILLFLRLAREASIISAEDDLAQAVNFIHYHFRTTTQNRLSYESLRKKYSVLDKNQIKSMDRMLKELLRINEGYLSRQDLF